MKYCNKCKKLYPTIAEVCDDCAKELKKMELLNDPVYLVTACGFERSNIEGALKDQKIPYIEKPEKNEPGANAITGSYSENHRILVPYQAYLKSKEILADIGVNANDNLNNDDIEEDINELLKKNPEVSSSMSPKITSTMMFIFLLLIMAAVFLTDGLTSWIKSLF
ncbi:MAG: hypothetical protein PUC88_03185 [Clostridia bacterium]|nr:hypothetical protein [Clostridia bacterium]